MQIDFYLLEQGGPQAALAPLAAKVLAAGQRLLIVAQDLAEREALSAALWAYRPDLFLANGLAGGAQDSAQPILISQSITPVNGARMLALADGQWREPEAGLFDRVLLVFGENTREGSRDIWRMAKARADWQCRFFKQEAGRWQQAG